MKRWSLVLLGVTLVCMLAWVSVAITFQVHSKILRWSLIALGVTVAVSIGIAARRNLYFGWAALLATSTAIAFGWATIVPHQSREWAPEFAHNVSARIGDTTAVIHNIRDFDWQTEDQATPRWTDGAYPLDGITSVDLYTSVWGNPALAHVLVGFGFEDGRHLVFSAETRREADEPYSSIGGFFKAFELVLIAAEERDIIRLRTNIRGEQVSVFPLRLDKDQARSLFVSYLERGNRLSNEPEFYNTVTANCTTVVFRLARLLEPGLPLDWRILASGYLPSYLYDLGALKTDLPLNDTLSAARITSHARAIPDGHDYSAWIRRR